MPPIDSEHKLHKGSIENWPPMEINIALPN